MIFSRQDWLTIIDPQFQYQGFRFFPEILTDTGKMKRKEGDWFKGKVTLLFGWTFGPVTSVGAIHNSTGRDREGQGGTGRDREGRDTPTSHSAQAYSNLTPSRYAVETTAWDIIGRRACFPLSPRRSSPEDAGTLVRLRGKPKLARHLI